MAWGLIWIHPDRSLVEEPQTALDPTPKRASRDPHRVIGGSPWDGALEVLRSRYLLGISGYMLLFSTVATLIYFTRMQMVDALAQSTDNNTRILAQLDMVTQTATLALQLVAARQIMRRFGVSTALAILPIFMALGFVGLVAIGTLAIVVALDVALKATERAITRPARETLFTVLTDEEKYKSKAFIDTFIYRGGDALGAGVEGMVGKFALGLSGLAAIALPMTAIWTLLGWWLGQEQNRRAERSQPDTENSTNP